MRNDVGEELFRACRGPLDKVPLLTELIPEEKPVSKSATTGKEPLPLRVRTGISTRTNRLPRLSRAPRVPPRRRNGSGLRRLRGGHAGVGRRRGAGR